MEWTEDAIDTLKTLWEQGISTAKIGAALGISKNAVVGKAHRLQLSARPSPIKIKAAGSSENATAKPPRRAAAPPAEAEADEAAETQTAEAQAAEARQADQPVEAAEAATEAKRPPSKSAPARKEAKQPDPGKPASRAAPAKPAPALRGGRHGPVCCWPLGEPGTPQFRFCDAPAAPGRPYCAEHVQIAYVRLRDRREDVA